MARAHSYSRCCWRKRSSDPFARSSQSRADSRGRDVVTLGTSVHFGPWLADAAAAANAASDVAAVAAAGWEALGF